MKYLACDIGNPFPMQDDMQYGCQNKGDAAPGVKHIPGGFRDRRAAGGIEHEVNTGNAADQEAKGDNRIQKDVIGQAEAETFFLAGDDFPNPADRAGNPIPMDHNMDQRGHDHDDPTPGVEKVPFSPGEDQNPVVIGVAPALVPTVGVDQEVNAAQDGDYRADA